MYFTLAHMLIGKSNKLVKALLNIFIFRVIFHFSDSAFSISKFFHTMTYFVTSRNLEMQHFLKTLPSKSLIKQLTPSVYTAIFFFNVVLGWCDLGLVLTEYFVFINYCYGADYQNISVAYNNEIIWQSQQLFVGKIRSLSQRPGKVIVVWGGSDKGIIICWIVIIPRL